MIIYKSKYFDDNKGNDDEISSKDRLKVAGAGLGAGVTALGINNLTGDEFDKLAYKATRKSNLKWVKSNEGDKLTEKEVKDAYDYLHKYAGDKYKDLIISDKDILGRAGVDYSGFHLSSKPITNPVSLTKEEFNKLLKENPDFFKTKLGKEAVSNGLFRHFIYSPKLREGMGIKDVGRLETLAHEIGHHEIDHAKSRSMRDFLEKVAQKTSGIFETTHDSAPMRAITRTALPFGITARNGWVVDEDDDNKIKLNKSSLIYPGVNVLGDSAVSLFERGASRRGERIVRESGIASKDLLSGLKEASVNNTNLRNYGLLGNIVTGAAATGLGLGVGRLRAELYKDKKKKETEETKNSLTGEYDRYVIPRKDNTKGLTEDEKKRLRNANLLGAASGLAIPALPLELFLGRDNIETAKKLAKEANLKDLAERANKQTHLKRTLPAALLTAGGIAGLIKANNMAKKKKEGE